jgi:hypothetical protein
MSRNIRAKIGNAVQSDAACSWHAGFGRGNVPMRQTRGIMTTRTSFAADIRPLFTDRDVKGMSKAFDLTSYDAVKAHGAQIYDRIRGIGGAIMPPPPPRGEGPWPTAYIELFGRWLADGCPR